MTDNHDEPHLTRDELDQLVARLTKVFDDLPAEWRNGEAIRRGFVHAGYTAEERGKIYTQMRLFAMFASTFNGYFQGWASPDLINPAADKAELMNLLCALDVKLLSEDVIDTLSSDLVHIFGGYGKFPRPLAQAVFARMDEIDEQYADEAPDEAPPEKERH